MNLPTSSDPFVSLVDTAGPAIVRVEAPRTPSATGLWWSDDGLVITAHHALRRAEPVHVALGDADPRTAQLLGRDPATDLAVLRVDVEGLPTATKPTAPTWRDGTSVRVGELGLALARPGRTIRAALGLVAVVSGEGLRTPAGRTVAPYLELDRTLPRGFSVAPLFDLQGAVLGLATAGLAPDAMVVLTEATVRASVEAIVAHGRVPQAYLGVGVSPARLPSEAREQHGQGHALAVVSLAEDGPAAQAGVLVGDLILSVAGTAVRSPAGLRAQLGDRVGQPVPVRLLRGGQTTELEITAGERQ